MKAETRISVTTKDKMPSVDHWAILTFTHYMSDGGYPESGSSPQHYVEYTAFLVKEEWQLELDMMTRGLMDSYEKKKFIGIAVKVAKTTTHVTVDV